MRHESGRVVAPVRRAKENNGITSKCYLNERVFCSLRCVKGARVCRLAQEIGVSKPASDVCGRKVARSEKRHAQLGSTSPPLLVPILPHSSLFHHLTFCGAKLKFVIKPPLGGQAGDPEDKISEVPSEHILRKTEVAYSSLRRSLDTRPRLPHSIIPSLKITLIDPSPVDRMKDHCLG